MKNKGLLFAFAAVVVIVSVAHARRGVPDIENPVTVNPLPGYSSQIGAPTAAEPASTPVDLDMGSGSLLDDLSK